MRRRIREQEQVSYWKSMVDAITTLMMVILLILMFFVLNFLVNNKDKQYDNDYDGYENGGYGYAYHPDNGYGTPTPTTTPSPTPTPYEHTSGGGGGDGHPDPTPTPVEEGDIDPNGFMKAAVHAILVDEDTNRVVEIPGVTFQLYTAADTLMTLTTHYPEVISYTDYDTTDDGTFFLPEKIKTGTYYFRQITEIPGYDFAADEYFVIDDAYDWDSPYIVRIPLGASKNQIQVQLNDAATGAGIPDVIFDVVADGDIVTSDGSVRYRSGETVDTIQCDETGYGLGNSIYIGDYILIPRDLPFGYAAPVLDSRRVHLEKRTAPGSYAPTTTLESQKTTVRITVTDELDPNSFIGNITYLLTDITGETSERRLITNPAGYVEFTDLEKNTVYRLQEESTAAGYIANEEVYEFTVDSLGEINGNPVYNLEITSRIIRLEINVVDRVTNMGLSGYNMSIINQDGITEHTWVSDGSTYKITGAREGIYTLRVEGSDDPLTINVENSKDIQKFNYKVTTSKDYILMVGAVVLLAVIIIVAALVLLPKLRRKIARVISGKKK